MNERDRTVTCSHVCPRRDMVSGLPLCDSWRVDAETGLQHCSWCGSIHPDQFMHLVRKRCVLTPTDKEYKVYVDESVARVLSGDTSELSTPPHQRKFYFEHLGIAERQEFRELHNTGRLAIGYPGNFYVTPYFMVPPRAARPSEMSSSSVHETSVLLADLDPSKLPHRG